MNDDDAIRLNVIATLDARLAGILNRNGACNLTVCPECKVDDFTHAENCKIYEETWKQVDF